MVGQGPLEAYIGVRIPAPEQNYKCWVYEIQRVLFTFARKYGIRVKSTLKGEYCEKYDKKRGYYPKRV
jgi:hypothetical protein